jgi:hypothetical protein
MGGGILTKEDGRLDNRETSLGESTVTVKWWTVLVVILSIMGFFFISTMNHEGRLTKIETTFGYITSGLDEVKALTREIREDQVRRYQREVRENK